MPYGTIKVDTVTFTDSGVDKSVSISGLVQNPTFSGNVTVTGTISGVTVTGTTASFTSGNFTNISVGTYTITSGVFSAGSETNPSISFTSDPNTGIYSPGADQVAISTNSAGRLFVDASGNVGVGITPTTRFHVYQAGSTQAGLVETNQSASVINFKSTGQSSGQPQVGCAASDMILNTNGAERLRITSAGLVGVGTSTPDARLEVNDQSSGAETFPLYVSNQGTGVGTRASIRFDVANNYYGSIGGGEESGIGSTVVIDAPGSTGLIRFTKNNRGTEIARFDSSGRLGIGTTSPSSKLAIVTSANSPALDITDASTSDFIITPGVSSGVCRVGPVTGAMSLYTANTERARIDSSGRLLVGTSTARSNYFGAASGEACQLEVEGNDYKTSGASFTSTNNSIAGWGPHIALGRSRGGSIGTNGLVSNGDGTGSIIYHGNDGSSFVQSARIDAFVDGTPGTNDMPGRLVFSTTADGASSPTERMRIAQNGVITIQNGAVAVIGTLTDGATITPDFAADCNFTVTLGGNRTIANPTNITAGQSGSIFIVQDATGSRTLSWGSSWDFPGGTAPTLSTAANAVDRIDYIVRSSTSIHTVFTANYS